MDADSLNGKVERLPKRDFSKKNIYFHSDNIKKLTKNKATIVDNYIVSKYSKFSKLTETIRSYALIYCETSKLKGLSQKPKHRYRYNIKRIDHLKRDSRQISKFREYMELIPIEIELQRQITLLLKKMQ
jgi:hypothetical protein